MRYLGVTEIEKGVTETENSENPGSLQIEQSYSGVRETWQRHQMHRGQATLHSHAIVPLRLVPTIRLDLG